jgi:hypothetical protein
MMTVKGLVRRVISWFKIRFVFTDEQLMDAIELIDQVDRKRLNDEKLWKQSQEAKLYLIKELIRRGYNEFIIGYKG